MKKNITRRLLALLVLTFPFASQAEDLIAIFDLAVASDPILKQSQAIKDAAMEEKSLTWAKLLPTISANASTGYVAQRNYLARGDDYTNYDPDKGIPVSQEDWLLYGDRNSQHLSGYINLRQTLLDLPTMFKLGADEKKRVKAALEYRIAQQELLLRVVQTYFDVLGAQGNLDFARAEKDAIAKQLGHTKQRFEIGLTAVTDVHEAQARYDLSAAQEIQAESELAAAKDRLRVIIGIVPPSLLVLKDNSPLNPPNPTNVKAWEEATLTQNLDITHDRLSLEIKRSELQQAYMQYAPTADFNVFAGMTNNQAIFGSVYSDLGLSINLEWKLFEGGKTLSMVRKKTAEVIQAESQLELTTRESSRKTRAAYLGVLAGISHVKALKQATFSNSKAIKAIQAGFDVGTRSALEVLDAQRELFRAQRNYAQARYNYVMNWLTLKHAVGLLVIDDLEEVNQWLH